MPPSRSKAKKRGRRKPPSIIRVYPHIHYNPQTGIFTITVFGHTRTATSDAVALWEKEQMFEEYAPERKCIVCGRLFKPSSTVDTRICSEECRSARASARQRDRQRGVEFVERYLYTREGTWIAEPHDARLKTRLKATFQTEREARDYIAEVMASTDVWRIRACRECGQEYDWYEEGLLARTVRCRTCGGVKYKFRSGKGRTRKEPVISKCRSCGEDITNTELGNVRVYCDACVGPEQSDPVDCLNCGRSFVRKHGGSTYCDACLPVIAERHRQRLAGQRRYSTPNLSQT